MSIVEPYRSYEQAHEDARFSTWLRARSRGTWEDMLTHRFVRECTDSSIDEQVYGAYLEQEYAFIEIAATALGYTIGKAPSMEEIRHLSGTLNGLVTDQREYFKQTFDSLGVEGWRDPDLRPETRHFGDLVRRAATGDGYAESLAPMLAAEWLYATWCLRAVVEGSVDPEDPVGRWILLHERDAFQEHAEWLRSELDRIGPELQPRRQQDVAYLFRRALEHEIHFHTAPYEAVT